jgi:hypothetical protein
MSTDVSEVRAASIIALMDLFGKFKIKIDS